MKIVVHGQEQDVDPNHIVIVAGGQNGGLRIFGLQPHGAVHVEQDPTVFVESLSNKAQFVKLNFAVNGHNFWANAKAATAIHPATENDLTHAPLAQSVVHFGSFHRILSNDVQTARTIINAAGGNV